MVKIILRSVSWKKGDTTSSNPLWNPSRLLGRLIDSLCTLPEVLPQELAQDSLQETLVTLVCRQCAQLEKIIKSPISFWEIYIISAEGPSNSAGFRLNTITSRCTLDSFHNHQTSVVQTVMWASEAPQRPLKLSDLNSTEVLMWELESMIQFNL